MGAELSINANMNIELFDEYGSVCINTKYISIIKLILLNCNTIPDKLPLNLEPGPADDEYFVIYDNTNFIFYKNLLIGKILNIVPIDNNLLIIITNIGIENFMINRVIQEIKKNEEKKKILNNEFIPSYLF